MKSQPTRHYLRRLVLPLVLLVAAIGYWLVAARYGSTEVASPVTLDTAPLEMPVVSLDRLPAFASGVAAQNRLAEALESLPDPPDGLRCAQILIDDEVVFDAGGSETLLSPSYAQMAITAFAAIELLGPDFRFETGLLATTIPDGQGVLGGNLFVVGRGDPVLMTRAHAQSLLPMPVTRTAVVDLIGALTEAGVSRVTGAVVGIDERYDDQRVISGWPERLIDEGLVGSLGALQVNDGFVNAADADAAATAESPAAHAADLIAVTMAEFGIAVGGGSRSLAPGEELPNLISLGSIESDPLDEIVHHMLATNDATVAELLVKELGVVGEAIGSTQAGGRTVQSALSSRSIEVVVPFRDGSGLGPLGSTSCSQLTATMELLADEHPALASLPRHDESAAFAQQFPDVELQSDLRFVGGSVGDASGLVALAGGGDRSVLTVASLINRPGGMTAQDAAFQQALVEVVDELWVSSTVEPSDE